MTLYQKCQFVLSTNITSIQLEVYIGPKSREEIIWGRDVVHFMSCIFPAGLPHMFSQSAGEVLGF